MSAPRWMKLLPRSVRHELVRRRVRMTPDEVAGVEVRAARTEAELKAAARLLHDSFVARGIMSSHPSRLRVTPHMVLPSSSTLIAVAAGRVVGTMTVFRDSPLGLPSEEVYPQEIARLRATGHPVAEIGALALDPSHRGTGVVHLINRAAQQTTERMGIRGLVIAVHPDAQDVYEAMLLFERVGGYRTYPGLNRAAAAVLLVTDPTTLRTQMKARFGSRPAIASNPLHLYFGMEVRGIAPVQSEGPRAGAALVDARASLARARMDVFRMLPPDVLAHLRRAQPNVLWPSHSETRLDDAAAWVRAGAVTA